MNALLERDQQRYRQLAFQVVDDVRRALDSAKTLEIPARDDPALHRFLEILARQLGGSVEIAKRVEARMRARP